MAVTTAELAGSIADVVGDLEPKYLARLVLTIEANTPGSLLLDTVGNRVMAGAKRVTIDTTTGAYSVTLVATDSTDIEPAAGRLYRATLVYPSGVPGAGNQRQTSGWFEITADTSLDAVWTGLDVTAVSDALIASIGDSVAAVEADRVEVAAHRAAVDSVVATNEGIMTSVLGSGGTFDAELSATFVRTISPLDAAYGAVGDDTADDTTALAAAIAAAPALFTTVDLRGRTYKVTDQIAVPAGVKVCNGAIRNTGTAKKTLVPTGDNVTIKDVSLVGRHATATASAGEYAIFAQGASAAAPLRNLHIERVSAELFGQYGIWLKWAEDWRIIDADLGDLGYSGITTLSAIRGWVVRPKIDNVLAGFSANGYGMAFSRDETDSLVTDPRSAHIKVIEPYVNSVPWEGIDTHGGEDIEIVSPTILGCKVGIKITDCDGAGDIPTFAPLDIRVRGGLIDSLVTDGSAGPGIEVNGVAGALATDAATQYATGISILGVTIRRHGAEASSNSGAILARNTYGLHVAGCDFDQPSPAAVTLYYDNRKAVIGDGVIKDAWTDTAGVAHASAVLTRSANNTATVGGLTLVTTGNKAATYLNTDGIYDPGTNTVVVLGPNDFSAATTKVPTTATHRFHGAVAFERQATGPLGTAAAPTYSFDGDTNTGIFSSTADDISIATAGTLRARWGTTGLLMSEGYNFAFGGTTGTKHGTATTQKQAWWGATPVVRPTGTPAAATDLATALTLLNDIRSKLITIGLIG